MKTNTFRCHSADACAMGQQPCPTPSICGCAAPACAVKDGTHKPAEAVHQIAEPLPNLNLIIQDLRAQHSLATPGMWTKGKTTHCTVSERPGQEPYHVAEFRHANDAAFCDLAHRHVPTLLDELERQRARIAELEKAESDLIAQRDHCEEIIDRMADAVLGKDRHEWSSAYDFMDAAQEVEDRVADLESQLSSTQSGEQAPVAWLAEYVDREGSSKYYVSTHKDLAIENDMNGSPKPLYTHPAPALEVERDAPNSAIYAEARECVHCNHIGINDSADGVASCIACQWAGVSPKEDKCPGCGTEWTMTASCPKCHNEYRLLADATIAASKPNGEAA